MVHEMTSRFAAVRFIIKHYAHSAGPETAKKKLKKNIEIGPRDVEIRVRSVRFTLTFQIQSMRIICHALHMTWRLESRIVAFSRA